MNCCLCFPKWGAGNHQGLFCVFHGFIRTSQRELISWSRISNWPEEPECLPTCHCMTVSTHEGSAVHTDFRSARSFLKDGTYHRLFVGLAGAAGYLNTPEAPRMTAWSTRMRRDSLNIMCIDGSKLGKKYFCERILILLIAHHRPITCY